MLMGGRWCVDEVHTGGGKPTCVCTYPFAHLPPSSVSCAPGLSELGRKGLLSGGAGPGVPCFPRCPFRPIPIPVRVPCLVSVVLSRGSVGFPSPLHCRPENSIAATNAIITRWHIGGFVYSSILPLPWWAAILYAAHPDLNKRLSYFLSVRPSPAHEKSGVPRRHPSPSPSPQFRRSPRATQSA